MDKSQQQQMPSNSGSDPPSPASSITSSSLTNTETTTVSSNFTTGSANFCFPNPRNASKVSATQPASKIKITLFQNLLKYKFF
jgi:hypothetical protein